MSKPRRGKRTVTRMPRGPALVGLGSALAASVLGCGPRAVRQGQPPQIDHPPPQVNTDTMPQSPPPQIEQRPDDDYSNPPPQVDMPPDDPPQVAPPPQIAPPPQVQSPPPQVRPPQRRPPQRPRPVEEPEPQVRLPAGPPPLVGPFDRPLDPVDDD